MELTRKKGRPEPASPAARQRGFSLIEVLVAAGILLIIALGILPLFTQAMVANTSGFDYSEVSNFARSRAEQFLQLPWDGPDLTIAGGSTEKVLDEYYTNEDRTWAPGNLAAVPAGKHAAFLRTTTVRQYSIDDLATPLDGATPPTSVHVKEIRVDLTGLRDSGPLGAGKSFTVRVYKSQ